MENEFRFYKEIELTKEDEIQEKSRKDGCRYENCWAPWQEFSGAGGPVWPGSPSHSSFVVCDFLGL